MRRLAESPKVLVADADPQTSARVERLVSEAGFPILIAADGPSAARALVQHRPLIVILGHMPQEDRPALREAIHALKATDFTHVIMMTAHAARSRLIAAWEVGVDEFLGKPVNEHELLARLRGAVRAIDLHNEMSRYARKGLFNWRRSRIQTELAEMSNTDELTGLANLHFGLERLDELWSLAQRGNHDMTIAIVDLDGYRPMIEQHGPSVGDIAIQQVGAALGRSVRDTDIPVRVSAQEFLLVFPDEKAQDILPALERCRRGVEACVQPAPDVRVTISAGVAERQPGMTNLSDFLQAADSALFEAKAAGKNQIVVSAAPPSLVESDKAPHAA